MRFIPLLNRASESAGDRIEHAADCGACPRFSKMEKYDQLIVFQD
jgi:hypothetical protein